jgi:hypothetical protein
MNSALPLSFRLVLLASWQFVQLRDMYGCPGVGLLLKGCWH